MRTGDANEARSEPQASGGPDGRQPAEQGRAAAAQRAAGERRRPAQAGLTLLEVLGAVALLGILYTALAGSAIEGLRSEGESRRRLEASLLADDRLAEIELSLTSGVAPPIGTDEQEVDGFTVATEVRPFELPQWPEADAARAEPTSLAAKRAAERAKDAPSLFAPPRGATAPAALLSLDVVVRWEEGIFKREVRRTTYAVDSTVVEAAFESLAEFQAEHPPEESPGDETGGELAEGLDRPKTGSERQRRQQPRGDFPNFEIPLPGEAGDEP